MTTMSPPLRLYELHPVEQLLALLLISAAALHRLFSQPPRPFRRRRTMSDEPQLQIAIDSVRNMPYRAILLQRGKAVLASHTIRELQQIARKRGIRSVDGRALKYCKKARLIEVLSND